MSNLEGAFDWRAAIRQHRAVRKLSRAELARRSGLSETAIKAYETGSRHPSQSAINALIDALGIPREEANPIRAGAGYAVDWYALLNQRYVAEPDRLVEDVERYPWPVFVANQSFDIVAGNRAFQKIWDIDLATQYTGPGEKNFLAGASSTRFVKYVENYEELITFMIGLAKGDPRFEQNPERPAPWLRDSLKRFLNGDPKYIRRFLDLWEQASPIPHRVRHRYDVRWRYGDGRRLRFIASLTLADIWNELSWNEWVPADEESWRTLREICEA